MPVGSVLYQKATVAYTEPASTEDTSSSEGNQAGKFTRVQIRIDSKVRDIEHGSTKATGQFNYTFLVEKDIEVVPQTYEEFMIWVDARRRAERVRGSIDGVKGVGEEGGAGEGGGEKGRKDDGRGLRITE